MKKNYFSKFNFFSLILLSFFLTSCASLNGSKSEDHGLALLRQELQNTRSELNQIKKTQEQLKQKLNEQERIVKALEEDNNSKNKKVLKKAIKVKKIAYTEPILLYKKGRSSLLDEKYDQAIKLFNKFLEKYPHNDLADNALYWIGECYYARIDFKKAIKTFNAVVEKYPRGMKVPDALLKTSYSYLSLNEPEKAKHYLKLVVEKYPFSEASEKAQKKLETFQ